MSTKLLQGSSFLCYKEENSYKVKMVGCRMNFGSVGI